MKRPADEESFQRLPRSFRLKRQRLIRPLFDRSRDDVQTIGEGCVRLLYRVVPRSETGADTPVQIGFAPGRLPKAVQRNRIKRILREVYRVNQDDLIGLFSDSDDALTMMILHRGSYDGAEDRIRRDLPRAITEVARELKTQRKRGAAGQ